MTHKTSTCRACGAPIIFLPTRKGKMNPVNAATVKPGDDLFNSEKHVSHFTTCPKASQFKRQARQETAKPKPIEPIESTQESLL